MDKDFQKITELIYNPCGFDIKNFHLEAESKEYYACRFELNSLKIISRNSKITPKKIGQFVTFWKRNENGPIAPFDENDLIDYFVINVRSDKKIGQFIFPKSVLIQKGIISTKLKEGKRGFRVYPPWNYTTSKQAQKTQKWQCHYFLPINNTINNKHAKKLYGL